MRHRGARSGRRSLTDRLQCALCVPPCPWIRIRQHTCNIGYRPLHRQAFQTRTKRCFVPAHLYRLSALTSIPRRCCHGHVERPDGVFAHGNAIIKRIERIRRSRWSTENPLCDVDPRLSRLRTAQCVSNSLGLKRVDHGDQQDQRDSERCHSPAGDRGADRRARGARDRPGRPPLGRGRGRKC